MMKPAAVLAALLFATPAMAQQQPPPDPVVLQLQIDEAQYLLSERRAQVVAAKRGLIASGQETERANALALQGAQEMLDLTDYLRACGDKPGCSVVMPAD